MVAAALELEPGLESEWLFPAWWVWWFLGPEFRRREAWLRAALPGKEWGGPGWSFQVSWCPAYSWRVYLA